MLNSILKDNLMMKMMTCLVKWFMKLSVLVGKCVLLQVPVDFNSRHLLTLLLQLRFGFHSNCIMNCHTF